MTESPVLVWTAPIGLLVAVLVGCSGTPAASLASTTIIFHDRDWLWRTEPDGRNLVQITDFGWLAEYSPESSRIAFGGCYESGI